jgi:hypothetical protein
MILPAAPKLNSDNCVKKTPPSPIFHRDNPVNLVRPFPNTKKYFEFTEAEVTKSGSSK